MHVEPLGPAQRYILALWLPFFFLNIVGEELWWRGFIQPRQEPVFGHRTWIVQGLLHGAFHVSFGLGGCSSCGRSCSRFHGRFSAPAIHLSAF
jgi:membrane protease YdiL (CAAX protease family)